jgi:hypothetical protein
MKEEQGKKMSPKGELPAGEDDKVHVPATPAALADADLDKVAGGVNIWQGDPSLTNNPRAALASPKIFTIK